MSVSIAAIEYYLPQKIITNDDLIHQHPEWDLQKVTLKTGVYKRHVADVNTTAFDMACKAVEKMLVNNKVRIDDIQGIIFCTQSPDYIMPSNAFLIHRHFGFSNSVWAFDYNLACSGFVYGLAICRGMIESHMAKNILLITADTYSKYINDNDRSTKVLFGDAAAATLVTKSEDKGIIDIVMSTAGKEFESFFIPAGGCRMPLSNLTKQISVDRSGNITTLENIHMNGFAVWKFISSSVPLQIRELLAKNNKEVNDVEFWGFHQASQLTLDSLYKALGISHMDIFSNLNSVGNTVSASIPLLIADAKNCGKLQPGMLALLSGFGVGLSWASALVKF